MNKNYTDNEALPHKKAGKNQMKSSPNKHGCEMNDYQPHQFAVFTAVHFFHMKKRFVEVSPIVRCVDCGKRARNNKPVFSEPIATVAYFGPSEGYWEVELNKQHTRLHRISKMGW